MKLFYERCRSCNMRRCLAGTACGSKAAGIRNPYEVVAVDGGGLDGIAGRSQVWLKISKHRRAAGTELGKHVRRETDFGQ